MTTFLGLPSQAHMDFGLDSRTDEKLRNLLVAMRARIARVWDKLGN